MSTALGTELGPETATAGSTVDARARSLTPRQLARRSVGWIVVAVIALLVAAIAIVAGGGRSGAGITLDASNPAPSGARALVQVLRQQGVTVTTAATLSAARAAATADSTLLVYDPDSFLTEDQYGGLRELAPTLVLVEPDSDALQALAPSVSLAGASAATGPLDASCTVAAAERARSIEPASKTGTLRITSRDSSDTAPVGCFPTGGTGSDTFAFVSATTGGTTLQLLSSTSILDNEGIVRNGNAALALNALGAHPTLVWYLPSLADATASGPPDLNALTPGWVTPVMLLLIAVFVAAAIWRGRRFGPLVVENLPVVVRSGETMDGRARLYQRSSARLHALDSLRIGAITRLAGVVGLPSTASVAEVADTVAELTGRDRGVVRDLLVDARPRNDRELVALSDRLDELESATLSAVAPTNDRPTGRMDP